MESTHTTRLFADPALRVQPDGRLVKLVRDGSERAFEEIVRRYGTALQRYAAAIVTRQRAEDVTQDAFSKAFVALRNSEKEIKLRPWLYRIVRNTALNELRDRPPQTAEFDERAAGGEDPADTLERRQRVEALMAGLAALPEPQRAAIVMRELEGLSHEQIAKSLGLSGDAVRQSIYRARTTLRNGVGILVPLPLLRVFAMSAGPDAATSAAAAAGAGLGIGTAAKAGIATLLVAGTATAGIAIHEDRAASTAGEAPAATSSQDESSTSGVAGTGTGNGNGTDSDGELHKGPGQGGADDGSGKSGSGHEGPGGGSSGPGSGDDAGKGGGSDGGHSGPGGGGSSGSGSGENGGSGSGSGSGGSGDGGEPPD